MHILMVHNHYLIRGGEDEVTDAEVSLLRSHGHEVDLFESHNDVIASQNLFVTGLRAIWSFASYAALRRQIKNNHYDVMHVQNFFPMMSPSIFYAARAENLPSVHALHNFRLECLNGFLFRDSHICEDCSKNKNFVPGIIHRCYRSSFLGSATVAAMLTLHKKMNTWQEQVDVFHTPSEFSRNRIIAGGISKNKVVVKPNFIDNPYFLFKHQKQDYAVFIGRMSPEKGIFTVLDAWSKLNFNCNLKIIGDGPLTEVIKSKAALDKRIEVMGRIENHKIFKILENARFLIFPSQSYETFGRTIVEAYSCGVPVLGSDVGVVKDLLFDHITGLKFISGSVDDLAAKVEWAWNHPDEMMEMGRNARREYEEKYTPEKNYEMLMSIYQTAIERNRLRVGNG